MLSTVPPCWSARWWLKDKPGEWSGIKALIGGTENIRDVLGNMIGNATMLIDAAVKNEARQKIAALAESERGSGKFMTRIATESRPVRLQRDEVINGILKALRLDRKDPLTLMQLPTSRRRLKVAPACLTSSWATRHRQAVTW
ncbi:MAG: hypothetical protein IPJ38_03560 [Dechloromonas sp.]|uniref:Uncharacterized protein n=1 Tax=Candidatus Dechloromonas phosphorivorans TaxID=2899244 RepID=A0A935N1U1_9RHOO|nr:hypothetical protein [Candidatus Dechloromonas phosphorivorans]